jgi:mRNA-degrading endonuclease toxin of MazEF toxin-antitoxin module
MERSISSYDEDNWLFGRLPKHEPAGTKPSRRCIATETTNYQIVTYHRLPSGIGKTGHGSFQVRFKGKSGQIVLDQIRTVDKSRLVKRLGKIDEAARAQLLALLAELFAP